MWDLPTDFLSGSPTSACFCHRSLVRILYQSQDVAEECVADGPTPGCRWLVPNRPVLIATYSAVFALLAPLSSLSPFSPSSPLDAQTVPYATDLKFMRASIDALPSPCYFNAYGSVIVNASSQEILCRGYNRQVSTGGGSYSLSRLLEC